MSCRFIKNTISVVFILLVVVGFYSCNNNELALAKLKQQNNFLKQQLEYKKNILKHRYSGAGFQPYIKLFLEYDTVAVSFISTLNSMDEKNIDASYNEFIKTTNHFFDSAKKNETTRFLPQDELLLILKKDSLSSLSGAVDFKKECIENSVWQYLITLADLIRSNNTSCGIRFDSPSSFGYRLSIQKDSGFFLLNLKYINPRTTPYPTPLEFISLEKCSDSYRTCNYETSNMKQKILSFETKENELFLSTKPLEKGFYLLKSNTITVSEAGKPEKTETVFNFEIN